MSVVLELAVVDENFCVFSAAAAIVLCFLFLLLLLTLSYRCILVDVVVVGFFFQTVFFIT